MSLEGLKIVIIGGSSGIGLASAKLARTEGAEVVIAGRSQEKLEHAVSELGDGVAARPADLASEDSIKKLFEAIDRVDHLLITGAEAVSGSVVEDDIRELAPNVDSRLWGSIYATKYAAPKMSAVGSITFFSGLSAWKPFPGEAVAAASAGAMESLARTLALELAPIRVNAICPGIIDTPLLDSFFGAQRQEMVAGIAASLPVGRIGRPEDIAEAAGFLMVNSFVTGTTLHVDGGHRLV